MIRMSELNKRQRDMVECMEATWVDVCHPFYVYGFKPTDKTNEREDWVEKVYAEVIDGNLKLEDYRKACDDLVDAITEGGK